MPHLGELSALAYEMSKETAYDLLVDSVDATTTYKGEAYPGALTSDAVWRIQKITISGDDVTIRHAASGAFSQVWDDRASLTYPT